MKVVAPLDIAGREIKVGDTVVYGVYTRNGGLQTAIVEDLKPHVVGLWVANPFYTTALPDGLGNERGGYEKQQHFKVKFKRKSQRYDAIERKFVSVWKSQTLDTPSRFAIIEPLDDPEDMV